MTTTLVLGGPRCGKSRHAEALLSDHKTVTYVATRVLQDRSADPDLVARIARHQERRPRQWRTIETLDLTRALLASRQPVLIDDLGSWVQGILDHGSLSDDPHRARQVVEERVDELTVALAALSYDIVVVTHDASWVRLPDDPAERLFVDLLSDVNQRVSAVAGRVHAILAGRVLDLSDAPRLRV
ncbi:bifunctional adenosylcobinamide kinase/adenosylcobinamide-phosphate guanylyltransferase [Ornithinimicrobium tianjinense]|uniref:Adenosylcobinamide kinase n=1 Tax=Ornithinimicrobium tianjinense TaxID=1195761 RepID=A0A917F2R1_9MICO|nr:bifunctional adenosylcobinamide kinase/adenosylcobinamide-phosphate guanylyltransferase [Ornithinimicrobium tianjinense]GGF44995.1 adenosylcobinamide kinase [Ornithinimicrobium tianjinense]